MAHLEATGAGSSVVVIEDHVERFSPHPMTSHTEHGLTYLVEGWMQLEHGGTVEARPGTFTVVPAGVPHRPLAGRDMHYWMLGFCATCLTLDEGQALMSPFRRVRQGALPVLTVPKGRRRHVVRLYRELAAEQRRGVPETPELVRSLVLLLLGEVRRALPGDPSPVASGTLVSDALETIQRRCLEPISLADVAAAVHRSPAHVASVVKKATGYSVGDWIRAGRVAEAAARLSHTDEPLQVIAERVGWRDKTHFIRQFRKAYGVTPAVWRGQNRDAHERDRDED